MCDLRFLVKNKGNYFLIIIEAIIIIIFGSMVINDESKTVEVQNQFSLVKTDDKSKEIYMKNKCKEIYMKNKDALILVNYSNAIPDNYNPNLRYTESSKEQVSNVLYNDLVLMLKDAKNAGFTYWIASAYRDIQIQQGLIDEHIDTYTSEGMSMKEAEDKTYEILEKASYSEHHTGLAIDFLSSDNLDMDESQEQSQGNQWMRDNCYKYGFILRYPRGKQDITHISYEPWHFRYVGIEASTFMYENNLTLEEFYEYL